MNAGAAIQCGLVFASAVTLAFAQSAGTGDTGAGVNTVLGDAMNPGPPRGLLDNEWLVAKHTPSGQLFRIPWAVPDFTKAASGWEYSGQLEFGYIFGDADEQSAQFRTYQDVDNGAYVNNFILNLRRPDGGYTVEISGGAAGRDDQYYGLQVGRANAWKLRLFFNEIPHVFTNRYKSLWTGIGTSTLTLVPGLTPGGTASTAADNAAVAAAATSDLRTLSLKRKRTGARLDLDLTAAWKGYVSYTYEERKGARPFGAVWGNSGGTAPIEIAEPINYRTHDVLAGLQFVDGVNALNLRFSASFFENKINTLTFQEPYRIAPPGGVTTVPAAGDYTQGRFDLTPGNQAYNVRVEYTRAMPEFHKSTFTAVVSAGTWRQDDNLIPYMVTPGVSLANVMLLAGGNWDSVTALSRRSADAVIDTRLADLTFSTNPTDRLNLKAKARYYETDNNTDPFLAVNPNAVYIDADAATAGNQTRGLTLDGVTGVWGRPLNDGSGQSVLMGPTATPTGNIPIKSAPYSSKEFRFGPSADYRFNKTSSLNASIERDLVERTYRDRDRTWDDRFKLGYVNRGLLASTLRVSYEFGRRRGSDYRPSIYNDLFSPALVPIPTAAGTNVTTWVRTNSGFRTYDLADRDQHVVNARLNTPISSTLDAAISLESRKSDFVNSDYGRTGQNQGSANLDLNYQPSPRQTIYGFYSYQQGRFRQASITGGNGNVVIGAPSAFGVITADNAVAIGSAPGGPIYPLLNAWTATSTDRNHVAGVGLRQQFGKASLDVDYSYSTGRTRIEYTYNVGGALNAANAALAGSRMPDLATDVDYLDATLRIPLTERLSARLIYRYQREVIRDWHYQRVDANPVVLGNNAAALPTAVVLDGGPQNFDVSWFGVMLQIKF